MKRVLVSFELTGDGPERNEQTLALWLRRHLAMQIMPAQWHLLTSMTVEEIKKELQDLLDPADRLLITQVHGRMSYRNLFGGGQLGAA